MMVDTIKNAKKGQSVGMVIIHSIAEVAASNRSEENDVHVDCEGQDDMKEVLSISDSDSICSDTEQSDTTPLSHH